MTQRPGGLSKVQAINDEVRNIALQMKSQVEAKAGKTFSTYNPVRYATQVVAGTNFFIDM